MPHHEPEADDPLEIQGVGVPDPSGESMRRMAECFAEEFLRLGHEPGYVLSLFEFPRYALPHRAYLALGAAEIKSIVEKAALQWRRVEREVSSR